MKLFINLFDKFKKLFYRQPSHLNIGVGSGWTNNNNYITPTHVKYTCPICEQDMLHPLENIKYCKTCGTYFDLPLTSTFIDKRKEEYLSWNI